MPVEATDGRDVLLFSTPDDPGGHRIRMTVWASFDGAQTWPVKRMVNERGEEKLYDKMALARFNLAWLTDGRDWRTLLKE